MSVYEKYLKIVSSVTKPRIPGIKLIHFYLCVFFAATGLGGHFSSAVWLGLFASLFAAAFLVWARDDENADHVDDDEEDEDEDDDDGGEGKSGVDREHQQQQQQQQKQRNTARRRRQRRRRRRTLLTTRTTRRSWTAAVRTTVVVTTILRLILSVGPEPTLWLLGAITVSVSTLYTRADRRPTVTSANFPSSEPVPRGQMHL